MDCENIKNDDKTLNFLTGISNKHLFKWLLSLVKPNVRFNTNAIDISKSFRTYLKALSDILRNFIVWPKREALHRNLPSFFKKFKKSTEVFIERPFNLNARTQTFSNYKSRNTIKYLVGITPWGVVSFLSAGWGGRTSDKEITLNFGFLDKITFGDCHLADRGFLIEEELATRGAVLRTPAFIRGKAQVSAKDLDMSRQIAHV